MALLPFQPRATDPTSTRLGGRGPDWTAEAIALRSVVKLRRHLEAVALSLVVIDPELRMLPGQRVRYLLHRSQRLRLVEIHGGHTAVFPVAPEVDGVAGQHDRAGLRQLHQQGLMTRRMPRRGKNDDAAIAEHVMIAFELGDGMLRLEPR